MTKATGKRVPGAHALLALAAATNTETNSNSLRSLKREAAEKARALDDEHRASERASEAAARAAALASRAADQAVAAPVAWFPRDD